MLISELLKENELNKSALPKAASINDGPELEIDDEEEGLSDGARQFVNQGGNLGSDLYTLTIYNYGNDWANVNPGTPVRSVIENAAGDDEANQAVVDAYLDQSDSEISNERMISQMIINARNGAMFAFSVGIGMKPQFNPSAKSLVEPDQIPVLKSIISAGNAYYRAVTKFDNKQGFKAGYDVDIDVVDATENLLGELNNPAFVKAKRRSVGDVNSAKEQEYTKILNDPNADPALKAVTKKRLARLLGMPRSREELDAEMRAHEETRIKAAWRDYKDPNADQLAKKVATTVLTKAGLIHSEPL
jgi:hypothetical protein